MAGNIIYRHQIVKYLFTFFIFAIRLGILALSRALFFFKYKILPLIFLNRHLLGRN